MPAAKFMHGLGTLIVVVVLHAPTALPQSTTRMSVDSSGGEGNHHSGFGGGTLSSDGRVVAFDSYASNLVAGDTNGSDDVFVHDRSNGVTERVSVDSSGGQGDSASFLPYVSADGRFVAFSSWSTNLVSGDGNATKDVFVHDRSSGLTEVVSVDDAGSLGDAPSVAHGISADGQVVVFRSDASNLVAGDTNGATDIFVRDRTAGTTERASVDSSGAEGNSHCAEAAISEDGRWVAFTSWASNLVAGDSNNTMDVFVRDRQSGTTERVSVDSTGVAANGQSLSPSITPDGRWVGFSSFASNLVADDKNGKLDVFIHDRSTGATERISVDPAGKDGNGHCFGGVSVSPDGDIVLFNSEASNLVSTDHNGFSDAFIRVRSTGITSIASVDSSGRQRKYHSGGTTMSSDGAVVLFGTEAPFVDDDTNGFSDLYVHVFADAVWSNYGSGFPGTNGVPALTTSGKPVLGSTITVTVDNSYGKPTSGLLVLGDQQAQIPTNFGGDLLVVPVLIVPITFAYSADTFTWSIPSGPGLEGIVVDVQTIELDPGAAEGMSFSAGLELVFGY